MITFLILISTLIIPIIYITPEYTVDILKCEFVIYLLVVILDIYTTKQFNLLHTWIAAFIYIIWSDMILTAANDFTHIYTIPIFFYLLANNLVLIGYRLYQPKVQYTSDNYIVIHPRYLALFLIIGGLTFLIATYDEALYTMAFGRILNNAKGGTTLTGSIISAIGLILPALLAYYFKYVANKHWLYAIVYSLPIIVIQAILATRFKMLFQITPLLIILELIKTRSNTIKSLILFSTIIIFIGIYSSHTKEVRNYAANETIYNSTTYTQDSKDDIFISLADKMSPEGIIEMAHIANDYFSTHSLSYGRESLTIFYFWIPRAWWPNKPTQLDYWLIRKYENVSDAHSTSSGFLGELRADFGWISLFFAILIGFLLKRCNSYIQQVFLENNGTFQKVFAALLYPYFFFFVRSPLTATITLIFCYVIYYILKRTICKRQIL